MDERVLVPFFFCSDSSLRLVLVSLVNFFLVTSVLLSEYLDLSRSLSCFSLHDKLTFCGNKAPSGLRVLLTAARSQLQIYF